MKRLYYIILALLIGGTVSFSNAQEVAHYQLSGVVEDAKTNEGLPFANVALLRTSDSIFMRGATTGFDGRYIIADIAEGSYLLRITSVGYETIWQSIGVAGDNSLPTITLKPTAETLQTVQITAKRPIFAMDGEKNLYNVAEDPTVQGGTAADALRSAPGVEVDMAGNITLRGVSSVDIWINGKPSHLDGESLKQYIKTLPANAIDRIEVITNPSARYSSSGGVINIVTNAKIQRNDFLTIAGYGTTQPSLIPYFSYVHGGKKGSINFYAGPKFTNDKTHTEYQSVMKDSYGNIVDEYKNTSDATDKGYGYFVGTNFDYAFDSMNTINGWVGIFGGHGINDKSATMSRILHTTDTTNYSQTGHQQYKTPGYWGGLVYEHLFDNDGHKLDLTFNGTGYFVKPWKTDEPYAVLDRSFESFLYNIYSKDLTNELSFQADYVRPISKNGTLEAGMGYYSKYYRSRYITDTINRASGDMANHSLYTHDYWLGRESASAYATYQHRWGMLTAKGGLRSEFNYCYGRVADNALAYMNKLYFDLMPSIHLTYSTKKMDNFKLSYTRRFEQPIASELAPYKIYNLESYTVGNPELLTTYTHNIEAGYSKFLPKFGYVSLDAYYHANTNEIGQLNDAIFDDNFGRTINYSKPVNMGSSSTLGAQLNVTYRPNAFVTLNAEGHLFSNQYKAQYREGETAEESMVSWSASLRGFAKVWKKVDLFCNYSHTSPTIALMTENGAMDDLTIGFSADLLDHHLTLFAGVNDPFNWKVNQNDSYNPYFTYTSNIKPNSRNIMFGLNLRFGKMELESKAKTGR